MENKTAITTQTKREIQADVLTKVTDLVGAKEIILPENYSPQNAIKSAFLILAETVDKDFRPALDVCTRESVANAMLTMCTEGLNPQKKQCYFVVYKNQLKCVRSYFGSVQILDRVRPMVAHPVANMVRENDVFETLIDPRTGAKQLIKHEQPLANMNNKIVAAYAILNFKDGGSHLEIMTRADIETSWSMSKNKGKVHNSFESEMCARTVIQKACKMIINSSSDSHLYKSYSEEDIQTEDKTGKSEVIEMQNQAAAEEIVDWEYVTEDETPAEKQIPNNVNFEKQVEIKPQQAEVPF